MFISQSLKLSKIYPSLIVDVDKLFGHLLYRHLSVCCLFMSMTLKILLFNVFDDIDERSQDLQGSYGQGKSGKTERVREKSGNFKILLTRPIIYALFSQFLPASGVFAPRPPPGLCPGSAPVNTGLCPGSARALPL